MPISSSRSGERTRPSKAAKAKRIDQKTQRGAVKRGARKSGVRLMYDFKIEAADKAAMYRDLASALAGLVEGEPRCRSPTWPTPRR